MATDNNSGVLRAIFSRTFVAISLINMLGMVGYYAIFVVCTRFAAEEFGANLAMAGLATGIVVIGCLVGRFFTGSIIHTVGYRRVLFIGVAAMFLMNAAYLIVGALWQPLLFVSSPAWPWV